MIDAFVYLTNALSCEHTLTMPRVHDKFLVQADQCLVMRAHINNA